MRLNDLLSYLSDEHLDALESVAYDEDPDTYKLEFCLYDEEMDSYKILQLTWFSGNDYLFELSESGDQTYDKQLLEFILSVTNALAKSDDGTDTAKEFSQKDHIIGKPKYKRGDMVLFNFDDNFIKGKIEIVDAYGTFEQSNEPSYDIYVEDNNTLYKHIKESLVSDKL